MSAPAKKKTLKKVKNGRAEPDPNTSNSKLYDDLEDVQDLTATPQLALKTKTQIINIKPNGKLSPAPPAKSVTIVEVSPPLLPPPK